MALTTSPVSGATGCSLQISYGSGSSIVVTTSWPISPSIITAVKTRSGLVLTTWPRTNAVTQPSSILLAGNPSGDWCLLAAQWPATSGTPTGSGRLSLRVACSALVCDDCIPRQCASRTTTPTLTTGRRDSSATSGRVSCETLRLASLVREELDRSSSSISPVSALATSSSSTLTALTSVTCRVLSARLASTHAAC